MPNILRMLSIVCALSACSVGSPVVDHMDDAPRVGMIECSTPPKCESFAELEGVSLHRAKRLEAARELELSAADGEAERQMDAVDWSGINVTIHADHPYRLTLQAPHLDSVFILLDGPITLRIVDVPDLRDLRLSAPWPDSQLQLENVRGERLSVREEDIPSIGTLSMHLVQLKDVDVMIVHLTVESALLTGATILSSDASLADVDLHKVHLSTGPAQLSAFRVVDSVLDFCGDAGLIDGVLQGSEITTCPNMNVRLYSCQFYAGVLDGDFELDQTNVSTTRLGVDLPTHIVAFESEFASCNVCEELSSLEVGTRTRIRCNSCVDSFDSQNVCTLAEQKSMLEADNYCEMLRKDTSLASCPDGAPSRKRPRS